MTIVVESLNISNYIILYNFKSKSLFSDIKLLVIWTNSLLVTKYIWEYRFHMNLVKVVNIHRNIYSIQAPQFQLDYHIYRVKFVNLVIIYRCTHALSFINLITFDFITLNLIYNILMDHNQWFYVEKNYTYKYMWYKI